VDDVPINLKILDLHVKGIGVKDIAQAASGREALKAIAEKRPDVVLTDMWMPEMSGADLATEIRKHKEYDGIPLVAVTADNDVGATFDASLFAEIVTKPVTAEKLRLALMHLFPNAR
jgi:CheY-like chemotaxis protein